MTHGDCLIVERCEIDGGIYSEGREDGLNF